MWAAHVLIVVAGHWVILGAGAQDSDEGELRTTVDVIGVDGVPGYTTYRLVLHLEGDAENVYAIFGDTDSSIDDGMVYPLQMPAAYQNPAPFGAHIGGVNKQIMKFSSGA